MSSGPADAPAAGPLELTVSEALDGERLDRGLAALAGISRGAARRAIGEGRLLLGGRVCKVASKRLRPGQRLALREQQLGWMASWPGEPPRVALETRELLVIDKPCGVAVQPGQDPELPHLLGWWKLREPRQSLWVVHRLDVPASGLVALARSSPAAARLSAALRDRAIERRYRVRTRGTLGAPVGAELELDAPLAKERGMAVVRPDGKPARTRVRVLAASPEGDELECTLESGRYHQIRAHLANAEAPVAGDRRYGGGAADRLHLHACELVLPVEGAPRRVVSPAPWDDSAES